jgi:hypothetical protein
VASSAVQHRDAAAAAAAATTTAAAAAAAAAGEVWHSSCLCRIILRGCQYATISTLVSVENANSSNGCWFSSNSYRGGNSNLR